MKAELTIKTFGFDKTIEFDLKDIKLLTEDADLQIITLDHLISEILKLLKANDKEK